jgi:hypothetical protein
LCLKFERDIRPLFRDKDRTSMLKVFDLWSHGEVLAHQDAILDQLRRGSMPCDGTWPRDQVPCSPAGSAPGHSPDRTSQRPPRPGS